MWGRGRCCCFCDSSFTQISVPCVIVEFIPKLSMLSNCVYNHYPWVWVCMSYIHAAHVLEESHDASDGVEFLTKTRSDWRDSSFGTHITWHLTLYYLGM